jgi:hypothetical protein
MTGIDRQTTHRHRTQAFVVVVVCVVCMCVYVCVCEGMAHVSVGAYKGVIVEVSLVVSQCFIRPLAQWRLGLSNIHSSDICATALRSAIMHAFIYPFAKGPYVFFFSFFASAVGQRV